MTTRPAHRTRPSRSGCSVRRTPRTRAAGAGAVVLLVLGASTACSSSSDDGSSPARGDTRVSGTVTVFAAASLTESFTTLGERFEKANPGTEVTFSFGGSDGLAAGITSGAPADVFASASPGTMKIVSDAGDATGTPATFVRNRLEIATLPDNPEGVSSLKDLTDAKLKVVLCDREVPCGVAAQTALDAGGLKLTPVSYEQDVRSALTKVALKEADAALVYRTDVRAAGDKVEGVDFPEAAEAVNDYSITLLEDAPNAEAAEAFVAYVRSDGGQRVLADAGFLTS
ncbi:molybdate ABC transporter substrate-binding protein [Streptomyces sp. KMM 9044]|uniref:molybdate ABC transporter substrate-binding protein n=1 Tax=Streptomyces sp. KMM 9044 TaxID=2744474 RepID=UPI002171F1DB